MPLIQQELDKFRDYWNNHKIRKQAQKLMPSGHIPTDALCYPILFGGRSCLICVPEEAQMDMHNILTEEVGQCDKHLSWYSEDFHQEASVAYGAIGSPQLSLGSAWEIFTMMAEKMSL